MNFYLILSIYAGFNIAIIVWFFIVCPRLADKEYNEKLREIYNKEWK